MVRVRSLLSLLPFSSCLYVFRKASSRQVLKNIYLTFLQLTLFLTLRYLIHIEFIWLNKFIIFVSKRLACSESVWIAHILTDLNATSIYLRAYFHTSASTRVFSQPTICLSQALWWPLLWEFHTHNASCCSLVHSHRAIWCFPCLDFRTSIRSTLSSSPLRKSSANTQLCWNYIKFRENWDFCALHLT